MSVERYGVVSPRRNSDSMAIRSVTHIRAATDAMLHDRYDTQMEQRPEDVFFIHTGIGRALRDADGPNMMGSS